VDLVTPEAIEAAARRIEGRLAYTPLLANDRIAAELSGPVYLKPENLQYTGSFKARGALNALLCRQERGDQPRGVATFSAGNHAAAVSFAARVLGIPAVVCMPPQAVSTKVEAVRRYGGEIVFTNDLHDTALALADERGYQLLHPFDDPDVIAGQGTVGSEIVDQAPAIDLVVVPVGGGGLISGVAAAVRAKAPAARIVGVEPRTANAVSHALRAGYAEPLPQRPYSLADGLTAPYASERTLHHIRSLVDDIIELDEDAIGPAWWAMLDSTKLFVEPSAAVGLAALRVGLIDVEPGCTTILVLSGGNVGQASLAGLG
jgi:threonine dehydratase